MSWAVLSGYVLALAAPWIARAAGARAAGLLALLPAGLTVHLALLLGQVARGRVPCERSPWAPGLGVSLSFRADGLSLLFGLLVTGMGAVVLVYSGGYLAREPERGRFFAFLLAFLASMLGLVLADNLLLLVMFWELTSVTSALLIGFDHHREEARSAALQALFVTSAGGLCLLAGVLILGITGGSFELSELLGGGERTRAVREDPSYTACFFLVLIGAAAKSAQVPFHFWLPSAMAAPAPVSAYLHSATMVNAGIYLLARLHPLLGGTEVFRAALIAVGAGTMLAGAYLAFQETDLKRLLAFSTVSTLGMLVMLLGWGTAESVAAAMVYLVAHAAYKGALFLVAGAVDHATGTRDVRRLGGLARAMPLTAAGATMAGLSMAGVPPWLGFLGKEHVYSAMWGDAALFAMTVAASVVNVLVAGVAVVHPFFRARPAEGDDVAPEDTPPHAGAARPAPREAHEVTAGMWLGPALLGALGLGLGFAAGPFGDAVISPATAAVLARPARADLSLQHALDPLRDGVNTVLVAGLATVLAGGVAYVLWGPLLRAVRPLAPALRWGPARWYEILLSGMLGVARLHTRLLQNGHLRYYLLITIVTTIGLVGAALVGAADHIVWTWTPEPRVHELVIAALILASTALAARARSRMAAVAALGAAGYGVALLFLLLGAPDLAMTQFAIETLTVILLVAVMGRLPGFAARPSAPARAKDFVVAGAGGAVMTALVLMVTTAPTPSRLSPYFAAESVPAGHGHNVVNVILVDFRGLDTLGEITVLAVAAIGGVGLLKLRPEGGR